DQVRLLAHAEDHAVVARRRDEERGGSGRCDERDEVDAALERGRLPESLLERHGQEEPEQDLDAGHRDAQLVEELDHLAVQPLLLLLGARALVGARCLELDACHRTGFPAGTPPYAASATRSASVARRILMDRRIRRETCICEIPTASAISRWVRPS